MPTDTSSPSPTPDDNARPESLHVEPAGLRNTLQHYIRDLVYGANDGLITTFAVVAGAAGGALTTRAVLIIGGANLIADGLSMGVGNYLGIRAEEGSRRQQGLPEAEARPIRHGIATFLAFAVAGALPLLPLLSGALTHVHFELAAILTFGAMFAIGAARAAFSEERWWRTGLEMLVLGILVAGAAYAAGAAGAWLLAG